MIDKNKLIEELNKMGQEVERHLKSAEKEGNVMFAFSIKNQLAMLRNVLNCVKHQSKMEKWILCSEKSPKNDGFYLATIDGEIAGEEKPFTGLAEFENGQWIDDEEDYKCILAWQPLPEPYQPKGEGEE